MHHTVKNKDTDLGCLLQSALIAVVLLAIAAFSLSQLEGIVEPTNEVAEAHVEDEHADSTEDATVEDADHTADENGEENVDNADMGEESTVDANAEQTGEDIETTEETPDAVAPVVDATAPSPSEYDPAVVEQGEQLFVLCAGCHAMDGRGLPGLGKTLVDSDFVDSLTDEELRDFVIAGRAMWDPANTTGIDMPSRGGNPALTDNDLMAIIAYMRTLGIAAASTPTPQPPSTDSAEAMITQGEQLFVLCSACHGMDARGITGLGKTLIGNEFVDSLTDEELHDFIVAGRPIWDPANTTGVDMPSRGGNPALTDNDLMAIIAYIRSLNVDAPQGSTDTLPSPPPPPPPPSTNTAPETTDDTVEAIDLGYDEAQVTYGEQLFIICSACHGRDARGLPGLGKDMLTSEFVASLTDEELRDFIIAGRPIWDPTNTTGVDMPSRGGNPTLTDDDLMAIIAYIRTLTAEVAQ